MSQEIIIGDRRYPIAHPDTPSTPAPVAGGPMTEPRKAYVPSVGEPVQPFSENVPPPKMEIAIIPPSNDVSFTPKTSGVYKWNVSGTLIPISPAPTNPADPPPTGVAMFSIRKTGSAYHYSRIIIQVLAVQGAPDQVFNGTGLVNLTGGVAYGVYRHDVSGVVVADKMPTTAVIELELVKPELVPNPIDPTTWSTAVAFEPTDQVNKDGHMLFTGTPIRKDASHSVSLTLGQAIAGKRYEVRHTLKSVAGTTITIVVGSSIEIMTMRKGDMSTIWDFDSETTAPDGDVWVHTFTADVSGAINIRFSSDAPHTDIFGPISIKEIG